MKNQLTIEQKILQPKAWYDAADRAEIRNEPALALYFRNQAWRIENGREWLDDVTVTAPLVPPAHHSASQS